ncbi:MAG: hypothetical protein E2576_11210 [Alcaligenaceae bacterium]|nr:hypothetical protein [Alcaligenaceae bacterium SAGV5]MPS51223.1 hypothetical protein [Alcaligenaceae bacterium SAGV3]MPT57280.1 hypothetical protein [Alcaligenaceae bacterium]
MRSATWEPTGIDRLYKRVGVRKASWVYKHVDGRTQTLGSAILGDRSALDKAAATAKMRALEIQQGAIVAGSVGELITTFETLEDSEHFVDQSKDGIANRKAQYENLRRFFGRMDPLALKMMHGYQYLEARKKAGAPARANKELALLQTICHYGIRNGVMETNPFVGIKLNVTERSVRAVHRRQVVRFYLWALRQPQHIRTLGCAAMFAYLTGYRAAEVRPFLKSGITEEGVQLVAAKRKKGEEKVVKLREWSPRLRTVVKRAQARTGFSTSPYLFAPTRRGAVFTKSGWGASWQEAMLAWITTFDPAVTATELVKHPAYFSLNDARPAAITAKFEDRAMDVYDFAAHASPATTHKNYDRRRVRRAAATE